MTVTQPDIVPGVYDIPEDVYHADPVPGGSLSSSGARKLLPPSCPAIFQYERLHRPAPKKEFTFGTAAHRMVLGVGADITVLDFGDWRTKKAQDARDEAQQAGRVPLLRGDFEQVRAMADALRAHPVASALFNPDHGDPEQTLIWSDSQTGIWRRALLDWLPHNTSGRMVIPDYKTARSASPEHIQRVVYDYGYHQQADWYLDGVLGLGLASDAAFVFVCQEKTPPYLVTVVQIAPAALRSARDLNRQAIDIYARCVETGHWPGYSDAIELISLPAWADR
ncbi:PD-(D/E)XK nuclease-like domain-containing protein [Planobispora rosea]|uniref:PD-(D/E)XK nuclease-like domain-containing protein n=1 Tax=Planobispora rosea TaxID=35762 RepID=UPI000B13B77B|nr:PD-(D/E)XK nuclease-like domain-containing protein [Planobispora rosea]